MFKYCDRLENRNTFKGTSSFGMPRSRRRHHSRSRSRSRSRSHSHDRDREPKRRKIDSLESPPVKQSVSCEPIEAEDTNNETDPKNAPSVDEVDQKEAQNLEETPKRASSTDEVDQDETSIEKDLIDLTADEAEGVVDKTAKVVKRQELEITPKKIMSPKQLQKKLESERKRQQKQLEREEREKKKQEERERARLEKEKAKEEKEKERLQKEEQRRKEKEEKEAKRKEKEEREEQKRKEREQEKLRKQQELEEKNKEKQKQEEQKQKAAAVFANFFVTKKPENVEEKKANENVSNFMPFEVKSDMRLPPMRRPNLTEDERKNFDDLLKKPSDVSYLIDLKNGKTIGKCPDTWPCEDSSESVVLIEEDFGETICEEMKLKRMRAKFLKFHENRRPAYLGTWRKKSTTITGRRPFAEDKIFDYEVDSDDDWEEEEQGESLNGSDNEDKENEEENDDYEVDNDFFVPHGHLSDDEVDDESTAKLSPESLKQKLKLLKDEFDQDMMTRTHKLKPRSIGCIWYDRDGGNVDEAIDMHLRPFAMITTGQVNIKKRTEIILQTANKKYAKELREDLIPAFLKLIHGNVNNQKAVVESFINYLHNNGCNVEISKTYLSKRLKGFAQWKKCLEEGPMLNKFCWCVEDEVKKKYNV